MKALNLTLIISSMTILAVACGGTDRPIDATLNLPTAREAKIALRPALDVSHLYDPAIADRIVIDEIDLNVSDVRLLGADPRVPVGGLALLPEPAVLEAYDGQIPALELSFPEYLAAQDDLAVYIRIDRSELLASASTVIRGRVYEKAVNGGSSPLTADDMRLPTKHQKGESIDPDGDPAAPPDCSIDPDGDPALPRTCHQRRMLVSRGESSKSVPFELRGDDTAELVTGVDTDEKLDVVIGIPAARWFTREAMEEIDRQLRGPATEEMIGKIGER